MRVANRRRAFISGSQSSGIEKVTMENRIATIPDAEIDGYGLRGTRLPQELGEAPTVLAFLRHCG